MLTDTAFKAVSRMFHEVSGILLADTKRALVEGRLQKLAQARGARDVNAYVAALLADGDGGERARVVDKLTTNETYFFREPAHFDHLSDWLDGWPRARTLRVWSGASSSGEEAYSLAMLLAGRLGLDGWEIVGTDLSGAMVEAARTGLYPLDRARNLPPALLKRWCLKGHGDYDGQLLVARELRARVRFEQANLMQPLPPIGQFDIIFLRNVLIYFDNAGKAAIVRRVLELMAPDGLLYTGHAESLANLGLPVRTVASAVHAHA
jgi:chemotaxis protein methyltransferase CheR